MVKVLGVIQSKTKTDQSFTDTLSVVSVVTVGCIRQNDMTT